MKQLIILLALLATFSSATAADGVKRNPLVRDFVTHILGIEILEPGCRKVRIRPNLGDLQFAEGAFPTPHGLIKVSHRKDANGKVITEIDAPDGVKVVR